MRFLARRAGAVGTLTALLAIMLPLSAAQTTRLSSAILCSACGHNLILNPGAEAGPGTESDAIVKVPDWSATGGFTAAQYAWSGGDISATTPGPPDRGQNYFYGGPGAAKSTGAQLIAVAAGGIATGDVTYVLSGWLGGYADQGDDATLYVTFEDVGGHALSTGQIGPVTPAQRNDASELLSRRSSGAVPPGTRKVVVELVIQRYSGSDNDGMADNLSLVFSSGSPTSTTATTVTTTRSSSSGTAVQFSPAMVLVPEATVTATLRSVSADGSVYTFSSATGPLDKLKPGSVMFLEGSTVRLVTSVAHGPSGLVVHTAPASITDLITNGDISWDTPVNFANADGIEGAGVPIEGALLPALSTGGSDVATPGAQMTPLSPGLGLGGKGITLKGKASGYSYSLSLKTAGRAATVTITLSRSSPVDLSFTASGTMQNFTTDGAIDIQKAKMANASVDMNGLSGDFNLSYELKPLTAFGLGASGGFKLTLPAEVTIPFEVPLPPGTIPPFLPMFLGVKVAVYIAVGFSNKNQSIKGAYTVHYGGQAGFSVSKSGATTGRGAIQGIGKVILDQANAILNGPISLVLGAQIPQIEVGLGGKGLNVAGFVDLVADTAIKVGGGFGGQTGCDARDLTVIATAGAKSAFFGLSLDLGSTTLFSKDFNASWPPGCGTAGV